MTVRTLQFEDLSELVELGKLSGSDLGAVLPLMEVACGVYDDNGKLVMAVVAERSVHLWFCSGEFDGPISKVHAIQELHAAMGPELSKRGYHEATAFLPDAIQRFGRRLIKTFGWKPSFSAWFKEF